VAKPQSTSTPHVLQDQGQQPTQMFKKRDTEGLWATHQRLSSAKMNAFLGCISLHQSDAFMFITNRNVDVNTKAGREIH